MSFYFLLTNKLLHKNISKTNEITFTNFTFIQAANAFCMSSHWFVFDTRTPESISNLTPAFFWIWWFFFWAVFFHGLFWNVGFIHVWLQLCKVRLVLVNWSFTFLSPIIYIFWNTVYMFRLWPFHYETCFIFKVCFELFEFTWCYIRKLLARCFLNAMRSIIRKRLITFYFK